MSTYDGGGAFPHDMTQRGGLTLRDYFAAKALPDAIKYEMGLKGSYQHFCPKACEYIAQHAYEVADAMLKARQA